MCFEGVDTSISVALSKAIQEANSYTQENANLATVRVRVPGQQASRRWKGPPFGSLKLNVDAGRCGNGWSFGIIFRDHGGDPICAAVSKDSIDLGVEYAEAEAIKRRLKLDLQKCFRDVVVESDCLKVINVINKHSPLLSYLELLLHEIEILSHAFS